MLGRVVPPSFHMVRIHRLKLIAAGPAAGSESGLQDRVLWLCLSKGSRLSLSGLMAFYKLPARRCISFLWIIIVTTTTKITIMKALSFVSVICYCYSKNTSEGLTAFQRFPLAALQTTSSFLLFLSELESLLQLCRLAAFGDSSLEIPSCSALQRYLHAFFYVTVTQRSSQSFQIHCKPDGGVPVRSVTEDVF